MQDCLIVVAIGCSLERRLNATLLLLHVVPGIVMLWSWVVDAMPQGGADGDRRSDLSLFGWVEVGGATRSS